MKNISGFGLSALLVSTMTFPYGFEITEWADDKDPLVIDDIEPSGFERLIDGTIYIYRKASAVKIIISVIPGSTDDKNLRILINANKLSDSQFDFLRPPTIKEIMILTIMYPDGEIATFTHGGILKGPPARSVMSSGRTRTNSYEFIFQSSSALSLSDPIGSVVSIAGVVADIFS